MTIPPLSSSPVPNGVEEIFFEAPESERGRWLLCSAVIAPRKRIVEAVEAAMQAKTPLWIIGRPYNEEDAYYQRFVHLQRSHPELIRTRAITCLCVARVTAV